jgi:enoyl-[acyl-carrier-protein] reductase (NADH)
LTPCVEAVNRARDSAVHPGIRVGARFAGQHRTLALGRLPGAGQALKQLRIHTKERGDEQNQPAADAAAYLHSAAHAAPVLDL